MKIVSHCRDQWSERTMSSRVWNVKGRFRIGGFKLTTRQSPCNAKSAPSIRSLSSRPFILERRIHVRKASSFSSLTRSMPLSGRGERFNSAWEARSLAPSLRSSRLVQIAFPPALNTYVRRTRTRVPASQRLHAVSKRGWYSGLLYQERSLFGRG
jgi:hypothetical protein